MHQYELTNEKWERIKDFLPPEKTGKPGRPGLDNRMLLNGMLWINHSGAQWRLMPPCYGKWYTVYARFAKWRKNGVWEMIFEKLAQDADLENISIDSTSVKVHQSANGGQMVNKAVGRSRGGLNTKIHALVDALGNPLRFRLSPGQDHDSVHGVELLEEVEICGSNVLGDKAYGTQKILDHIEQNGATSVIPPKSNSKTPWPVDYYVYKERHLVECFFQKIKWFRRVATRYDKLDQSFLAFVYLASIMILLE